MALVQTPELEFGKSPADFTLRGTDDKFHSLADFAGGKGLVIMFICNHCPYVKAIEDRLIQLGHDCTKLKVPIVAICSNDASSYPEDSFINLKRRWTEKKYPFPYLHDEDQSVARAYGAVCTPDFFVYDQNTKLAYRGRLDDSWKDETQVKHRELLTAVQSIAFGKPLTEKQHPSMGCSIKWKT